MKSVFALFVALVIWWSIWMSAGQAAHAGWAQRLVVPAVILVAACIVVLRHERQWAAPARRLVQLVPKIRAGGAPIGELDEVGGALDHVTAVVQELLHEIRRQQLAMAELNDEFRQRVALRTDALERQIGSLRQQAARDPLTGLYNRRMLDTLLPRLLERCRDQRADLAVLMIDIDHFKPLNDTLGHQAGDELLRNVGRLIRSSLGENDLAIRYGGDEFLLLKSPASVESVSELVQRLTTLVDQLARPLRLDKPPRLSIGAALLSQLGHASAQDLLEAADRNLYAVKQSRRPSSAA